MPVLDAVDNGYHYMNSASKIQHLREAGCGCHTPLLGWRPGQGPRCRLCNTIAPVDSKWLGKREVAHKKLA